MSYDAWQEKGNNEKKRDKEKELEWEKGKHIYSRKKACAVYNNILKTKLNC